MNLPSAVVLFVFLALVAGPPAQAADCAAPPDSWLLGNWSVSPTHLTVRREGKDSVWEYRRHPGLVTERWGEKQIAAGKPGFGSGGMPRGIGHRAGRRLARPELASPAGVEPATPGLGNRCSIQLSYGDAGADI